MKMVGFVLIAIGVSLCLVVLYSHLKQNSGIISPIPNTDGVRVIIISPKP